MAINAGDIVWNIGADAKSFEKALDKSRKGLQKFGSSFGDISKKAGMAFTAMGAGITASIGASVKSFATAGDEVQKMASRTGFATETLSELRFAAERSGTTINSLETATKKMSKAIFEAGEEAKRGGEASGTYTDALASIGLSYEQLQGLNPEEQFLKMSMALAEVSDHTSKAAIAQELFGKAGTDLLPMLEGGAAGLQEMRDRARELGIVFDQESANKAAAFNDAMLDLRESSKAFMFLIAESVLPGLTSFVESATEVAGKVRSWAAENPQLFSTLTMLAGAIGGVMVVLGPLLIVLPGLATAFSAIAAIAPIVAAAIGAISIPVLAVIAAVAAAAVLIVKNWEWIKMATAKTFNGIVETIAMFVRMSLVPINTLINAINWVINKINQLTGMNIGSIPGFAQGGVVPGYAQGGKVQGFASGGAVRMIKVGERGPEMMAAPVGSRVVSHPDMMRAISQGAAAGAGGGGVSATFNINVDGSTDTDALMQKLKGPFSQWMADEFRRARR